MLGASKNARRFDQQGDVLKTAVQRKGVWMPRDFTAAADIASAEKIYEEENKGMRAWSRKYWDEEGWLVDEGRNHEGHIQTRFGLVGANTMQMRVRLVVPAGSDPPKLGPGCMVREYSRDGPQQTGEAPRVPDVPTELEPQPEPVIAAAVEPEPTGASLVKPEPEPEPESTMPEPNAEPKMSESEKVTAAAAKSELKTSEPANNAPENEGPANTVPPPIVFIHGIMGSTLVDGAGVSHYLTAVAAACPPLSTPSLSLPTDWRQRPDSADDWTQSRDGLTAGEVLRNVGPVQVYGPFVDWLSATFGARGTSSYTYDWRRDNNESADLFIAYLEKVKAQNNGRPAQVVAHSNGGLISFAALNERPDLFHSVLFCGVPFGPGASYLRDMHKYGVQTYGINSEILKPDVLATHSSYLTFFATELLKEGEEFAGRQNSELVGPSGECVNLIGEDCTADYGGAWEKYELGAFQKGGALSLIEDGGAYERRLKECRAHLAHSAAAARRFRKRLAGKEESHYQKTPIGVLTSRAFPTNCRGFVYPKKHGKGGATKLSYENGEGDGTVPFTHSFPPKSCASTVVHESQGNHFDIMGDHKGMGESLLQLQQVASKHGRGGVNAKLAGLQLLSEEYNDTVDCEPQAAVSDEGGSEQEVGGMGGIALEYAAMASGFVILLSAIALTA